MRTELREYRLCFQSDDLRHELPAGTYASLDEARAAVEPRHAELVASVDARDRVRWEDGGWMIYEYTGYVDDEGYTRWTDVILALRDDVC